jgi:nucleotide-binding universal stress UspA family protein
MRLGPGCELGGFTLVELLHKGGMANLWRVTHPAHASPMILKTPRLADGEDPAAIVGFEMEQMILPRLDTPHAPRCIAVGDDHVTPFIVMEHLPGASLLSKLKELPLAQGEVAFLGAKVAQALAAIHHQDVIHLDVKPSNILFRENGQAVLIDYGLAHHARLPDLMQEEFRVPFGTAPYIAPEQVMGVRTYRRSDLFALGVLMYFFATGERPFGDPQSAKGMRERIWRDPAPPRKLNPAIPPWLQEVILHCLEVDPDDRPHTAAQLAMALRHPENIILTERAHKMKQDDWVTVTQRRFARETWAPAKKRATESKRSQAPIIVVAVDLDESREALVEALRAQVRVALNAAPDARVACVNVLKLKALGVDEHSDADGASKHIKRLVDLRAWAQPLHLPEGRVTFHVLEAIKPADALLDYARMNHVDHIVMGARANSISKRFLGSVSAEVAAQAPCTVTVVRHRADWAGSVGEEAAA